MIIRNERDLVALQAFKFAGKQLQPGDGFRATSTHARLLCAMGRAAPVVQIEVISEPTPAPSAATPVPTTDPAGVHVPTTEPEAPAAPVQVVAPAAAPAPAAEPDASIQELQAQPQEASPAVAQPSVAEQVAAEPTPVAATSTPAADPAATATRTRRARGASQA